MNDTATTEGQTDETVLSVDELHVSYGSINAIRDVTIDITDGSFTAIIGPNGAGKSTFADTITGFKTYNHGSVHFRGTEVSGRTTPELVSDGLIYCTESKDLFDYMTVRDNLDLGAYHRNVDMDERREFVYDIFPKLEEREEQMAETMSGGEQQMLAIGRALMGDPELLVLDEPSLGLAPVVLEDISHGINQIKDDDMAILLFEQNITFALDHADHMYLMENGSLVREGTPAEMKNDDHVRSSYMGT